MQKIKWKLATLLMMFAPIISSAQDELTIDQKIDKVFRPIADFLGGIIFHPVPVGDAQVPIVLFVLIGGALFFTIYFILV